MLSHVMNEVCFDPSSGDDDSMEKCLLFEQVPWKDIWYWLYQTLSVRPIQIFNVTANIQRAAYRIVPCHQAATYKHV